MQPRRSVFLKRLGAPGAEAFAVLFALESVARALLATVVPLEAFRLLGDAGGVSMVFFIVSVITLVVSLSVPWIVRMTARRWVYSGGFICLAAAPLLLAIEGYDTLLSGMLIRAVGSVVLAICLNLYILDFIAKKDLNKSEPMRLFYSAAAWSAGPFVGVLLAEHLGRDAPLIASGGIALFTLGYFWFLRIADNPAVRQKPGPTPSPLAYVKRYFRQPRLTLAWLLSIGRNIWWVIFFIYTPIYAVKSGLGEVVGGAIVSAGTGFLYLMPLFGWFVRWAGLRNVFVFGYIFTTVLTVSVVFTWTTPWVSAALLVCAAFGMVCVDAGGNLLFLFAVRRHERPEMTTVYSTYRDVADILPPGVFAVLLRVFELPVVFVTAGAVTFGLALLSGSIHPRLAQERRKLAGPAIQGRGAE